MLKKSTMLRLVSVICMIAAILCSGAALGQVPVERDASSGGERVHIDHADHWHGETRDSGHFDFLVGHVELSQDSTFMYCDSAVILDKREVSAFGNVIIQKGDSLTIFADTLVYDSETQMAILSGEVLLEHVDDQLWTTHLQYDLQNDIAYYDRSAVMVNDSTQISSRIGYYWVNTEIAKFIDSVVVIGDQVTLLTDSLLYAMKPQRAEFLAPTWILQDTARIYCEAGYYNVKLQEAEFRQNAEYVSGDQHAWADTIRYTRAQHLVDLSGDAHFEELDRKVNSDRILYFEDSGLTLITGNATFRDSVRFVESDYIEYNRNTELLKTRGRSVLVEGDQILLADSIDFDQATGIGDARGHVVFEDTTAKTIVLCEHAEYNRETDFIKAYGVTRPLLKSFKDEDTMYVTADTFIFDTFIDTVVIQNLDTAGIPDSLLVEHEITVDTFQRLRGFADVRLLRGTMQSLCDHLLFDSRDSTFYLRGSPVMWSDTSQYIADSIDILLRNSAIDKVYLSHDAFIINSVQDRFYNQIKGSNMVAIFVDDEIHDLTVTGNAESIYYAQDEENAFVGVNRVAASEILFTFVDKGLDRIRFYTNPTGKMMPMDQVNHQTFRLDGFLWKGDLRPISLEDLF